MSTSDINQEKSLDSPEINQDQAISPGLTQSKSLPFDMDPSTVDVADFRPRKVIDSHVTEIVDVEENDESLQMDASLRPIDMFRRYIDSDLQLHRLYLIQHISAVLLDATIVEALDEVLPNLEIFPLDPESLIREAFAKQIPIIAQCIYSLYKSSNSHNDILVTRDNAKESTELKSPRSLRSLKSFNSKSDNSIDTKSLSDVFFASDDNSPLNLTITQVLLPLGLTLFLDPDKQISDLAVSSTCTLCRVYLTDSVFEKYVVPLLTSLLVNKKEDNAWVVLKFIGNLYLSEPVDVGTQESIEVMNQSSVSTFNIEPNIISKPINEALLSTRFLTSPFPDMIDTISKMRSGSSPSFGSASFSGSSNIGYAANVAYGSSDNYSSPSYGASYTSRGYGASPGYSTSSGSYDNASMYNSSAYGQLGGSVYGYKNAEFRSTSLYDTNGRIPESATFTSPPPFHNVASNPNYPGTPSTSMITPESLRIECLTTIARISLVLLPDEFNNTSLFYTYTRLCDDPLSSVRIVAATNLHSVSLAIPVNKLSELVIPLIKSLLNDVNIAVVQALQCTIPQLLHLFAKSTELDTAGNAACVDCEEMYDRLRDLYESLVLHISSSDGSGYSLPNRLGSVGNVNLLNFGSLSSNNNIYSNMTFPMAGTFRSSLYSPSSLNSTGSYANKEKDILLDKLAYGWIGVVSSIVLHDQDGKIDAGFPKNMNYQSKITTPVPTPTFSAITWPLHLKPIFLLLIRNTNPNVRKPVVHSLHLLISYIGKEIFIKDVYPILEIILLDEDISVRMGIYDHLSDILGVLLQPSIKIDNLSLEMTQNNLLVTNFLHHVAVSMTSTGNEWRAREAVAKTLKNIVLIILEQKSCPTGPEVLSLENRASLIAQHFLHSNALLSLLWNELISPLLVDKVCQVRMVLAASGVVSVMYNFLQSEDYSKFCPKTTDGLSPSSSSIPGLGGTESLGTSLIQHLFSTFHILSTSRDYHLRLQFVYVLDEMIIESQVLKLSPDQSIIQSEPEKITSILVSNCKDVDLALISSLVALDRDPVKNVREAVQDLFIDIQDMFDIAIVPKSGHSNQESLDEKNSKRQPLTDSASPEDGLVEILDNLSLE